MSEGKKKKFYSSNSKLANGEKYNQYIRAQGNTQNMNVYHPPQYAVYGGSHDRVRKLVEQEGRTARNLILWSVPVDDNTTSSSSESSASKNKPPSGRKFIKNSNSPPRTPNKIPKHSSEKSGDLLRHKKFDLRARYWAFLFDNLRRAVDEIYQTCEADESVIECKEAIMMLENYTKDFRSLIEWLHLKRKYENTDPPNRPTSLAWEVRKSSPGKNLVPASPPSDRNSPSPVQRSLDFSNFPKKDRMVLTMKDRVETKTIATSPCSPTGDSWADKVKGFSGSPGVKKPTDFNSSPINSNREVNLEDDPSIAFAVKIASEEDDSDGWETVQRSRPKLRNSSSHKVASKLQSPLPNNKIMKATSPIPVKPANVNNMKNKSLGSPYNNNSTKNGNVKTIKNSVKTEANKSQKRHSRCSSSFKHATRSTTSQSLPTLNLFSDRKKTEKHDIEHTKENLKPIKIDSHSIGPSSPKKSLSMPNILTVIKPEMALSDTTNILSPPPEDMGTLTEHADTEEEEELVTKLDSAVATALEEEENLENLLEKEQEQALESAIQEEENLTKELEKEENTEVKELDEIDTDVENENPVLSDNQKSTDWNEFLARYDAEAEVRAHLTWGDMVEAESRAPGRALHMHEKLSSPSRKRSLMDTIRRHEEKQAKAQEQRERLMEEKSQRLRELSKKVEEVRAYKEELLRQRRMTMEKKLERAEEKRQVQLKMKIRKAHEEETKVNEIAFINTLEAQNKRHDVLTRHQGHEARLQDLQEGRQRRQEEKAAKEAAAEERRKALQAERLARLQEMQEKRKQRDLKIEQQQQEKEKERIELAREKARDREQRLSALSAAQEAHVEELQKKIQQKQEESTRRHEENIEHIRQKAFELSVLRYSSNHDDAPKLTPYETKKLCNICNVLIASEVDLLSHLRGKKHQQSVTEGHSGKDLSKEELEIYNLKHIVDAPADKIDPQIASDKERQKFLRKRCKKLRQRLASRGEEYENSLSGKTQVIESDHKAKLLKGVKDINKYFQSQGLGPWPTDIVLALDRVLGEMKRVLEKKSFGDQIALRIFNGVTSLCKILSVINDSTSDLPTVIPAKSLVNACIVLRLTCRASYENCHYMLFSNKLGQLIDFLFHRLNILVPPLCSDLPSMNISPKVPKDNVATSLMQLIATIMACLAKNNPSSTASEASFERMGDSGDAFMSRGHDIISYIVSVGIFDKLKQYLNRIRGPVEDNLLVTDFLVHTMGFLIAISKFMTNRNSNIFEKKKNGDPTQLIATLRFTELVGTVSLLYSMLLHAGAPSRSDNPPPQLSAQLTTVTTMALRMLNYMALLDLDMLQSCLGEEGVSLQFRHIASYLLWYLSHWNNEELLHEVILIVGYFTILNPDNQIIIQSGQMSTVLQQLCNLPFAYFSDPRLTNILFPSLISCCYENNQNKEILEQEMSSELLANFMEEKLLNTSPTNSFISTIKKPKSVDKEKDENRWSLAFRFPQHLWIKTQVFFSQPIS